MRKNIKTKYQLIILKFNILTSRTFLLCWLSKARLLLVTTFRSHHAPSIVMIVINVFSNSIIIVHGLEHALAKGIIVVFGEFWVYILCSLS